ARCCGERAGIRSERRQHRPEERGDDAAADDRRREERLGQAERIGRERHLEVGEVAVGDLSLVDEVAREEIPAFVAVEVGVADEESGLEGEENQYRGGYEDGDAGQTDAAGDRGTDGQSRFLDGQRSPRVALFCRENKR